MSSFRIKLLLIIILSITMIQCDKQSYIPEKCQKLTRIQQLSSLKILDTLISFSAKTDFGQDFQLDTLKGAFTIIFFKHKKIEKKLTILLNEEIKYKNLGKITKLNNGNLIIANEGKLYKIYGISLKNKVKPKENILIVSDKNKIIKEIYKNACEEDIIKILKQIQTSPQKK